MDVGTRGLALFAATFMIVAPVAAQEVKAEGVILSHSGNQINIRTREGPMSVIMAPTTTIKEAKGVSRKTREATALIPGLIIKVEGQQQGEMVRADKIQFKESDWRSAIAAKAGTQEELGELRRAIIGGQEYVVREEATVYFPSGSAVISEPYKQQLRQLAQKAPSHGNYRISILGFADPRGNQAANERLSMRRAMAVSNYLRQTGLIEPGRVLSPSAMGEGTAAPGEAMPTSHDSARRVLARVVTPKVQLNQ